MIKKRSFIHLDLRKFTQINIKKETTIILVTQTHANSIFPESMAT